MELLRSGHFRRVLLVSLASSLALQPWSYRLLAADAQDRPLRVILPFAPGSPGDVVLRAVANRWQAQTGQRLLVDHRPGAGGTLGAGLALQAAGDGSTLLFATSDVLINNTALVRGLHYDPQRDFRPIARIGPIPLVLCVPADLPVADVAAFATWARTRRIAYGSWGEGSHAHILGAVLARILELDAVHVAYGGLGPMLQDLMKGQVAAGFAVPPAAAPLVAAGRLKALAVTGRQRSVALPTVPTLAELGYAEPAFELLQWAAFMAPARIADARAAMLERELGAALAHEDTQRALQFAGFESAQVAGPEETRLQIARELALVPPLIRELGVLPQ